MREMAANTRRGKYGETPVGLGYRVYGIPTSCAQPRETMLLSSGPFHFENVNAGGRKSLVVGPAVRADHADVEMRFKFRIFVRMGIP